MELDIKDKKLLHELELNARQANSAIAKKVGISKDAVGYRIKQLENKKIIRGYRAVVNMHKLGYTLYRIYLNLIDYSKEDLKKIILFLEKDKSSWWIAKMDGSWNFAFAYWAKSGEDFYNFYKEFSKKFRKHIKEKLICPILEYHEFPRGYLIKSKKPIPQASDKTKLNLDSVDLEILKILAKNARTPLIDIAEKLKLDNMTIHHRIKKLEDKKIISGYKVDIDDAVLERDFYTVEINLKNFSKFEELKNEILQLNDLSGMSISIGGYDLEFDLKLKTSKEYYEIIDKLKTKFTEIREINYFRVIENYKILYMPEE